LVLSSAIGIIGTRLRSAAIDDRESRDLRCLDCQSDWTVRKVATDPNLRFQ
jgi:hypothetical protein